MDAQPVLDLVAAATGRGDDPVLVGIGGRGGAGKTTLAGMISGAQIVSTDEFWDGVGFDIQRLAREVVWPLARRKEARFSSWDWSAAETRGVRVVEPTGVIVVEGVCALHRRLREAYAVRVWVDAPDALRLARGVERDGEAARSTWANVWMPSEDRYVTEDDPVSSAQVLVDGSSPL